MASISCRFAVIALTICTALPPARIASAQASAGRTIQGVVKDSATGETLPNATVTVEGTAIRALTNRDGRFALISVPPGRQTAIVTYIGYRAARVTIDSVQTSASLLTVRLAAAPVRLSEVFVSGTSTQAVEAGRRIGEVSVSTEQVATTPSLGEKDVFRTLQLLPGVSGASKGTSGMYIRGGTPDQNLVLFDGMTMYHVDHFFGIFSAFNADAIKDIRLYAGGYPAKYGGRVSSVVDLTGKTGDEGALRGNVGLSLLSGRALVEIPLGRGALLLSGRRSYTDVIRSGLYRKLFESTGATTTTPSGLPPRGAFASQTVEPSFYFYDGNAKLSYRPSSRDLLSLSAYGGTDNLDQSNVRSVTLRAGPGGQSGIGQANAGQISNTDISDWGNRGVSARWLRQWVARLSSDVLVASSRYHSNADRSSTATLAATAGGTGTLARPSFIERNTVDDLTLRLDNEYEVGRNLTIDFGGWFTNNRVRYDYTQSMSGTTTSDTSRRGLARDAEGKLSSFYAQGVWSPVSRVAITTGVRSTAYDLTGETYVEPRMQATIQLTDGLALKGAWGTYHQFVNQVENEDVLSGSRDFWLLADSSLRPTSADHRIVGLTLDLRNYLLSVEAYDKSLEDVALFSRRFRRVSFAADYNTLFYLGTGRARGVDVLAQRKFGALTGWLSYSLGEATQRFADVDGGKEFPASHDQRHEFKAVGTYQLGRWTFASAFIYGSGTPYTSPESEYYLTLLDGTQVGYVHVGDKNAARLPAYHRLDLAAFRRFKINDRFDWELGASVFNLYNRNNVAYRRFDLTTTPITVTDAHTLGLTPSLDVRLILK